jgi:phage repressor protein C with HTH and peptisase S24 domain
MLPVLRPGQIIIASGLFRDLRPEAVVIVYHDKLEKVKRVQKIKGDRLFLVGDNPKASIDSRSFGWLPLTSVVAKVLWPRI